jgi:hypothetical protein
VPVLVLDVSDDEADILLASYDPLTSMASEDGVALKALIDGLATENDTLAALMLDIQERWGHEDLLAVNNATDAYHLDNPAALYRETEVPADEHGQLYKAFLVHLPQTDHDEVIEAMFKLGERWELDTIAEVMVRLVREVVGAADEP